MRNRTPQVERIASAIQERVPCYRDPFASGGGRVGADGKVYPTGERWDWRRIALRREAVAAVLETDPKASVRVVRDVLARFGHRVSHEQVRLDMTVVAQDPPGRVESGRWLPLDAWRDETARRRRERARAGSSPQGARRKIRPSADAGRRDDWAVWDDAPRKPRAT